MSKEKCLVPTCDSDGTRRGLCSSCRNAAKREIEAGRTTEAELIENGLLKAKTRKGRLAVALDDRRKKERSGECNVSDSGLSGSSDARTGSPTAAG
jgi:hypothetical protein